MPSKTSLLNKAILKNIFRRFYWMGALYFIALLFAYPINILLSLPTELRPFTGSWIFRYGHNAINDIIIYIIPVLFAAFLFHYLQGRNSSDMIHSLPIKRSNLYNNHVFAGVMFLTLPVVTVALISWVIISIFNLGEFITATTILSWMGTTLLMNMVLFLSTVFAGVVTGVSVAQVILTYIVLFLPTGFIFLGSASLEVFLSGFNSQFYMNDYFTAISPLMRINVLPNRPLSWTEVLGYIIFCVVLYFLGQYLYSKRKLEKNLQVIVFSPLYQLFKYGVTFCAMLLGGAYFYSAQRGSIPWLLVGYGLASFIGFWVAEGVLQKSVRIFSKRAFKCYLGFVVITALFIAGITFDITGYETRVPDVEAIKAVYFDYGLYRYQAKGGHDKDSLYTTDENIASVQALHEKILAEGDHEKYKNTSISYDHREAQREMVFVYHLKNGRRLARSYYVDYDDKYKEMVKPIHESLEDKLMKYEILRVGNENIKKLVITPDNSPYGRALTLVHPDEIKEAMDILKQEYIEASFEELTDPRVPWAHINIMLDDPQDFGGYREDIRDIYTYWNKGFTKFEAWLESKGYLKQARIIPEEISYVVVEKVESREAMDKITGNPKSIGENNEKAIERFESSKIEDIEASLENYSHGWDNTYPRYVVGFYNASKKQMFFGYFPPDYVPQFVKDHFEK